MNRTSRCSAITNPLCMILAAAVLLALPTASIAQEPGADDDRPAITFGKLIFREQGKIHIGEGIDAIGVNIIERMRQRGYNAVGAENLLFNEDKSYKADFVLGGTVSNFECSRGRSRIKPCNIAVNWELYDRREGEVVYKVLIWYRESVSDQEAGFRLIMGALGLLLDRPVFNQMLNRKVVPDSVEYDDASFRRCDRPALSLPEEMDKVLDATFVVKSDDGATGSGFIISPDGLGLTNYHVVGNAPTCKVTFKSGFSLTAKVLRADPERDVVLLSIPMENAPCLPVARQIPGLGTKVFAVGAPLGEELAFSVSSGIVSGVRKMDDLEFVQTDASVNPGNSGGPLVDEAGRSLAVVTWKVPFPGVEGLGFGIPSAKALEYISMNEGTATGRISTAAVKLTAKPQFPVVDTPGEHPSIVMRREKLAERRSQQQHIQQEQSESRYFYSGGRKTLFGVSLGLTGAGLIFVGYGLYTYSENGMMDDFDKVQTIVGGVLGVAGLGCLVGFLSTAKPQKAQTRFARLKLTIAPGPGSIAIAGRF